MLVCVIKSLPHVSTELRQHKGVHIFDKESSKFTQLYVTFNASLLLNIKTQHNIYFLTCTGNCIAITHWNATYALWRVCILITECLLKLHYTPKLRRDVQRQNYDTFSHAACSRHIINTDLKYCVGKGKGHSMAYPFRYWSEAVVYQQPIRRSALGGDRSSISCSGRPNTGKDRVPIVQEAGLESGPVLKAWKM